MYINIILYALSCINNFVKQFYNTFMDKRELESHKVLYDYTLYVSRVEIKSPHREYIDG